MAAGLGFKTFTTGEVLTAADVNGYLMQGVLVFASAAARNAAITSPQEGQCCYLKDTDAVLTYSGAAWVGFDDSNAIQNSIVDAKGDLVAASGADTPARLAVGSNGETLVADSSTSTGLRYQASMAAGKNALINGNFDYWQRGTTLALTGNNANQYLADRWICTHNGSTAGTVTASRQSFTVGQTDVPNNPTYFARITNTTLGTSQTQSEFYQYIEDVSTFAGQTATISFYAKASATFSMVVYAYQNFGSGGSGSVFTTVTMSSSSLTTGWVKYTGTVTVPSISGKTVGTGNFLGLIVRQSSPTAGSTFDLAQAQWELGSVATQFTRAGGTLQGELAACQRYYESINTNAGRVMLNGGYVQQGGVARFTAPVVQKRTTPTVTITGTLNVIYGTGSEATLSSISELDSNTAGNLLTFRYNTSGTPLTSGQACGLYASNNTTFGISAEL